MSITRCCAPENKKVCAATAPPQDDLHRCTPHRKHFYSWVATDKEQLEKAESVLLRGLEYYQATIAGLNTISTDDIQCVDDTQYQTAVACQDELLLHDGESHPWQRERRSSVQIPFGDEEKEILLLVHGFAGGVAGWAQNWRFFAERFRVYAFDLPGFARSERRNCVAATQQESMDFMCEYLQRWFQAVNFGKPVIVLAHSFGCFVSAHFAMRSGPRYIRTLLFAEPWGVNHADPERIKSFSLPVRVLLRLFYRASPLALLRGAGPMGPALLRRARPDLSARWGSYLEDPMAISDYVYHCNAQRSPVGELMFRTCCHYDACARKPLSDELPMGLDKSIELGLLFGKESWIKHDEGMAMALEMREMGFDVSISILGGAGHQIFTDQVNRFNETVENFIACFLSKRPTVASDSL